MSPALLTEITHLASRLQSAGMQHAERARGLFVAPRCTPPSLDELTTHAASAVVIASIAKQLSFKVGQLQGSLGGHAVRKSELMPNLVLGQAREALGACTLLRMGMLADSEGGCTE